MAGEVLEAAFERAGVGLCLVGPDNRVLRANARWLQTTGLSVEQILGKDAFGLFPELRELAVWVRSRAGIGHLVPFPRHCECLGGPRAWWVGEVSPIEIEMEGDPGLLITARDVSNQAAAELESERLMERSALLLEEAGHRAEELSLERDRLRALVESMADEVWFCDAEGNLLAVNQAAAEGPGFPLEQQELFLGGESPDGQRESSEAATPPAGTMPILRSLRGETLRSVEHVVRHPRSGDAVSRQVSSAPVRAGGGQIVGAVAVIRDVTELVRMREDLRVLALVDELTGLYNRRGFLTLAQQQMKLADRTGAELSVLVLDQDKLKGINDTFGHQAGDEVLAITAGILRETCRESDVVARIGGDEFVVLAPRTPLSGAVTLRRRLAEGLETRNACGRYPYRLSVSVGIATYTPGSALSIEHLLARADADMYEQKRARAEERGAGSDRVGRDVRKSSCGVPDRG